MRCAWFGAARAPTPLPASPPWRSRTATTCRSRPPRARWRTGRWRPRSARHRGLVVLDAEDLAAAVAVARQRAVAVDARAVVRAAVPQLAHVPAAAAIP